MTHTFPTRRSSDLGGDIEPFVLGVAQPKGNVVEIAKNRHADAFGAVSHVMSFELLRHFHDGTAWQSFRLADGAPPYSFLWNNGPFRLERNYVIHHYRRSGQAGLAYYPGYFALVSRHGEIYPRRTRHRRNGCQTGRTT